MKDHSDHDHENLCWLDLETTGTDPAKDAILELGVIITTKKLEHVAAFSWVVTPSKPVNLQDVDPFVWKMHQENCLWDESLAAELNLSQGANMLVKFIIKHKAKGSPLCGNTINFDRGFLKAQAPEILHALHYRNIDVSTLKNVFAMHFPKVAPFNKPKGNHRVIRDLENSIAEYRHYLAFVSQT